MMVARSAFKEGALFAVGEWVERATPGTANPGRRLGNSPSEKAMVRMEMERNGQMQETAGSETDTPWWQESVPCCSG